MNKIKTFLIALFRLPICACGKVLNPNPGIRQGITMAEARKYLVTAPHSVHDSNISTVGVVNTYWQWNSADTRTHIGISFKNGILSDYHNITPDIALTAMPHEIPQLSPHK